MSEADRESEREVTYGGLLHLLHDVEPVREGERRRHAVPDGRDGRNERVAHQRVNTVRWWPSVRTANAAVIVVVVAAGGGAVTGPERAGNVVIVKDYVLIDLHHAGLSWRQRWRFRLQFATPFRTVVVHRRRFGLCLGSHTSIFLPFGLATSFATSSSSGTYTIVIVIANALLVAGPIAGGATY